jgi:hypothetical protein
MQNAEVLGVGETETNRNAETTLVCLRDVE